MTDCEIVLEITWPTGQPTPALVDQLAIGEELVTGTLRLRVARVEVAFHLGATFGDGRPVVHHRDLQGRRVVLVPV